MASQRGSLVMWLLLLTLGLSLPKLSTNQRTFMRSCDCEPTPDGKCAYTLMLPMTTGETTCSTDGAPSDSKDTGLISRLDSLEETVLSLEQNISQVNKWTADQARMLSQLQSKLLEYSGILERGLDGQNASENINCTDCARVMGILDQQNNTVGQMRNSIVDLERDIRNNQEMHQSLKGKLEDMVHASSEIGNLSQKLQEAQLDINSAYSEMKGLKEEYFLCKKKSLLVSGDAGYIEDAAITASSFISGSEAVKSRIKTQDDLSSSAWCAVDTGAPEEEGSGGEEASNTYEWLQFDLGSPKMVYGVVTRGRYDYSQWVESYKLQYANDWTGDEGWSTYQDVLGLHMVFPGNTDKDTAVTHMLWQPIRARYVRFVPITAYDGGNKCMRADVIGCLDED